MKQWLKILSASAVLFACLNGTVSAQEKIMIGEPAWPGAKIIASVIEVVIIDKLGGKAERVPGTNPVIFKAMGRGKGDIDVHPDVWLPNQQSLTDKYVDGENTVALSKNGYEGSSGFCVPSYIAEEKGIKSIFDLATPDGAKAFDSNGDGKGEIWLGEPTSAGTKIRQVKFRDYGIEAFFEGTGEEEPFAYAKVGNAVSKKEGVVFACYKPHYLFKLYELTILEEPPYDPENYKMVQPDQDPDWFAKSTVKTGDSKKIVRVAYSRSLETRAPDVANFLANIELDSQTVSAWTHELTVEKKDPTDVAREWVNGNGARVDKWLGL